MTDFERSIVSDPRQWQTPDDVARREVEMREGILRARQQEADDRARTQQLSRAILTPEPTWGDGFAEAYALHVDAETGEYFRIPRDGGQDDDPGS